MANHQMKTRARMLAIVAATAFSAFAGTAAHAETSIKMVLNWKYDGPQGLLFLAEDRG